MSVFDTSAVLAILYNENGRNRAEARLAGAVISTVNVAEVLNDVLKAGRGDADSVLEFLNDLKISRVAPDDEQALRAGELKLVRGLSLGDCFCIALGESRGEPLVTGDQQWLRVPTIRVPLAMIR